MFVKQRVTYKRLMARRLHLPHICFSEFYFVSNELTDTAKVLQVMPARVNEQSVALF